MDCCPKPPPRLSLSHVSVLPQALTPSQGCRDPSSTIFNAKHCISSQEQQAQALVLLGCRTAPPSCCSHNIHQRRRRRAAVAIQSTQRQAVASCICWGLRSPVACALSVSRWRVRLQNFRVARVMKKQTVCGWGGVGRQSQHGLCRRRGWMKGWPGGGIKKQSMT